MEEIFRLHEASGLLVSNLGRVKTKKGNFYNLKAGSNGYVIVGYIDSKTKRHTSRSLHRLVAELFIPNPNNLPQVNHRDEDKSNNTLDNLEWCDASYNQTYGNVNKKRIKTRNERSGRNAEKSITLVKNGQELTFKSIQEASRTLRLSQAHLVSLRNRKKGFRSVKGWSLKGDEWSGKEKSLFLEEVKTGQHVKFDSREKAAAFFGVDSSNLMKSLARENGSHAYKGWRLVK